MQIYQEITLESLEINIPAWIDQDLTQYDIEAIIQGGCDSGAYMPAVTYYDAGQTMKKHGDDILDYLHDNDISLQTEITNPENNMDTLNCLIVSSAVELWAYSIEEKLKIELRML